MYYRELDMKKVEQLFNKYRDPATERVLSDGIIKFLADLDLSPEDRRVLILAFKFRKSKRSVSRSACADLFIDKRDVMW